MTVQRLNHRLQRSSGALPEPSQADFARVGSALRPREDGRLPRGALIHSLRCSVRLPRTVPPIAWFLPPGPAMTPFLCVIFVLSGAAGLIYESIWTRYLGLFVGHDAYAQILVLVIFLGGMSLGAILVSRRSERIRQPLYGYVAVEFAVGCIGLRVSRSLSGRHGLGRPARGHLIEVVKHEAKGSRPRTPRPRIHGAGGGAARSAGSRRSRPVTSHRGRSPARGSGRTRRARRTGRGSASRWIRRSARRRRTARRSRRGWGSCPAPGARTMQSVARFVVAGCCVARN